MRRWLVLISGLVLGCSKPSTVGAGTGTSTNAVAPTVTATTSTTAKTTTAVDEPMGDAAHGKELVKKLECARCHDGLDVAAVDRTRHCVACHQDVMAGKFDAKPNAPTWRKHVAHLAVVPSLAAAGKRFQYGWLVSFIAEPRDLRPGLMQMMPRLAVSQEDARDIAAFLGATKDAGDAALEGADEARGRKLMDEMQCGSCHRMTGVAALDAATPPGTAPAAYARESSELRPAVMLAPDLAVTRERMSAATVVAWLLDPAAMKADTAMPKTSMSPAQARDIAAYILKAPLQAPPLQPVPVAEPPLSRRVTYDEVAKVVLDVTCRHCHGNPDVAVGDGGPGNTGGFGFAPRGVQLTKYEEVQGGYLDEKNERHSLFEKMPDGTPRIIAALWARHHEVAGHPIPGLRGMPLGLPPLPPEQIQIMATWVAAGRPK